jgi:hypothetical protein
MELETGHSNDKTPTSRPDGQQSNFSSADKRLAKTTQQLIALATAFRETLTPECLAIYVESLSDLSDDQVRQAVGRAIRELKFFPRVAELRELAGAAAKDQRTVEAEAAWKYANAYLREWGVDRMPLFRSGATIEAPPIPARIDYALRRIGGLRGLNQITEENRPFVFKDFCEAYNLAPIADSLAPQLTGKFPAIEGQVKQLPAGAKMERRGRKIKPSEMRAKSKPIPQPLTDAQRRDRLEILRQQAQFVHTRDTNRSAEPCSSAEQIPGTRA